MIKINLLSEGKRPTAVRKAKAGPSLAKSENAALYLTLAGIAVPVLLAGLWLWIVNGQLAAKNRQVAEAQKEVDELKAVLQEVEEFKVKKAELEHKIQVINELKANQRGPVLVMDYISRALPDLLWLDRLQMTANTINLTGRAFNMNAVANFIENLDRVPEFQEPILRDSAQQGQVYTFVINLNYSATPPKTEAGGTAGATGTGTPAPGGG